MEILMRTLKVLLLATVITLPGSLGSPLQAQTWGDRGFANVGIGIQMQGRSFTETSTPDFYTEKGLVSVPHDIGSGPLVDVGVGGRVWRNFGIGLGYSMFRDEESPLVTVRVPHPIVFGGTRETTVNPGALEHSEQFFHLQVLYLLPITTKFDMMFFLGPSFIRVEQDFASVSPADIVDVPPFTSVSVSRATVTTGKANAVGLNVGADATYLLRRFGRGAVGVGGFLRYSGGSAEMDTPASGPLNIDVGGFHAGVGLRVRF
jgi:hypothetical protein